MHTAALHLAPVLAAEKSKTPFYVAGGVLVIWALVVSLGLGLRRVDFPSTPVAERAVMAITAVLVLAAVSTAVITSGPESEAGAERGAPEQGTKGAQTPGAQTPSTASTPAAAPTTATSTPAKAPAPSAVSALKLNADPAGTLSFNTKQLSAKAGTVKLAFTNMSPIEHDVTIASGGKVLAATPVFIGGSRTLTTKLAAGKYTFYCSVPGHRQAGMEGTLSVS
jgi:plastocyanin